MKSCSTEIQVSQSDCTMLGCLICVGPFRGEGKATTRPHCHLLPTNPAWIFIPSTKIKETTFTGSYYRCYSCHIKIIHISFVENVAPTLWGTLLLPVPTAGQFPPLLLYRQFFVLLESTFRDEDDIDIWGFVPLPKDGVIWTHMARCNAFYR
jgi:hypothetical protein